jgi:hypothetical protein
MLFFRHCGRRRDDDKKKKDIGMNVPVRQTCSTATVSLVFGILSWCVLPIIGAIVAIIAGHMARGEIARSNGTLDGDGIATVGLVLGWAHLAFIVLVVLVFLMFFGGLAILAVFFSHLH